LVASIGRIGEECQGLATQPLKLNDSLSHPVLSLKPPRSVRDRVNVRRASAGAGIMSSVKIGDNVVAAVKERHAAEVPLGVDNFV